MVVQNSFNNTLPPGVKVALGSDAQGDTYYLNSSGQLARLPIGTAGQVLSVSGSVPVWSTGVSPGGAAGGDLSGSYPNPTIANSAVTYAKLQNVTTQRLLGRNTAGSGTAEELDASTVRTLLGLGTAALTNTGTGNGNVPLLDSSGKLNSSVIPSIALTSIQVVANQAARLALSNVEVGDVAKQSDNGLSYILSVLPASTDSNWIAIGDTSIDASDVVSGTIATARLGSGTANASSYLRGDQSWQTLPFVGLPWTEVTGTSTTLAANNGYRANNAALVTLTLPSSAALNTTIRVMGMGAGGWRIAQSAGQQIIFGNLSSTSGATGRLDSTHARDAIELICIAANTTWQVISSIGNIDVV